MTGWGNIEDSPPPPGFEDTPPHVLHVSSGLRVWFSEPLGIVTQIGETTRADASMGAVLTGTVTAQLFDLRGRASTKFHFTHDWSRMAGYSTQVRSDLTSWGIRLRGEIERITVVLSPTTPTIVRMGIDVAAVGLRLAGISLDVDYDIAAVARRLELRPLPSLYGTRRV